MLINLAKLLKYEFRRFKGRSRLALFFVLIIPLLYGGVYLHANWDLYANTDDVPIAVVDLDEPTTFGDRTVDGGNQLEGQLKNRPMFDWRFMGTDSQAALDGLRAGDYYMVITIPKDFSKNLVSAGDYKPARATLQLRRDDANGFIIGLLTSQVETSLGKALDESVTQTYFESVFGNLQKIKDSLGNASDGAKKVSDGNKSVNDAVTVMNTKMLDATKSLGEGQESVNRVNSALNDADSASSKLTQAVGQARNGSTTIAAAAQDVGEDAQVVNAQTGQLIDQINNNLPALQQQAKHLVTATGKLENPNGPTVTTINSNVSGARDASTQLLSTHPELAHDAHYIELVKNLSGAASATTTVSSNVAAVANASAGLNLSLDQSTANQAAQNAKSALDRLNRDVDKANAGTDQLKASMATAESGAKDMDSAVHKATQSGREATEKMPKVVSGVVQLSNGLGQLKKGTDTLTTGASQLSTGLQDGYKKMPSLSPTQTETMSKVMSTPVDVEQTVDHPAKYYGRGLAPMFFSIAMWISAISTFLVLRTISGRAQAGRASSVRLLMMGFGPAATVCLVGALIMIFGVWLVLGLDPVHPWLLLLFVTVTSLAWMAMAHVLRLIMGSPQTAVFLILLVLQLPTCGGTFPVTMLPAFYEHLAVFMPMKYSVDAFRYLISDGPLHYFVTGITVQAVLLAISLFCIAWLGHRHKRFRMRDLHPPMVTSTSSGDYAFSVHPR